MTGKRELGLGGVFSIAAGAMISSGLFVLPGLAFARSGPAVILAYALASLLMIPVMLSAVELSTAMPRAGGNYFFIERSMGPLLGTVAGLADWLAISLKATFALIGLGALAGLLFPEAGEWALRATALGGCVLFGVLNAVSTKESGRLQYILVVFLLLILVVYIAGGFPCVEGERYLPFVPMGWQSVFAVAGMVFVSFGGLTKVVAVSEEVVDPTRNLPLGMFLAFGTVSLLYVLVSFVTVGVVDGGELSGSLVPLVLGAEKTLGGFGGIIIKAGAFLAFATTANSGIMAASRAPMAMSRDGLMPGPLSKVSERFGTPIQAIILTAAFMSLLILFLNVEDLVKTASTMMILTFMLVNISVIVMRESGIENYRPTSKAFLYPWIQVASTVIYGFLIFEMGRLPLMLAAGFVMLAVFWYFGYVRQRIDRQSALLFMVKRILSRHIARARLDEELVSIVLERDNVSFDRFDHLVKDCRVLDIKESVGVRELFRQISEVLPETLGLSPEELYELFLEREREGSTVIQPGLAIPHVIVPGKGIFELVLVRCKEGIIFSELHAPVKTAFVLVGSRDERNYHLRALMSVAQVVQEEGFESRWFAAGGVEQLRDVVLLSGRTRDGAAGTDEEK